jgi:hypothetical protein
MQQYVLLPVAAHRFSDAVCQQVLPQQHKPAAAAAAAAK